MSQRPAFLASRLATMSICRALFILILVPEEAEMATPQDISKPATTPEVTARRKPKAPSAAPVPEIMKQGPLVPWLYLLPALVVMTFFIVYPMINTIGLSFLNKDGTASAATTCRAEQPCWGVFENYRY